MRNCLWIESFASLQLSAASSWVWFCVFFATVSPQASWPAFGSELVVNPRVAPNVRTYIMNESWRAGAGADEDFVFGVIGKAAIGGSGDIYLLDTQQQIIWRFSSSGEFLGSIARRGEGPGDIDRVYSMITWSDEVLGCLKVLPATILLIGVDGGSTGSIRLSVRDHGDGLQSISAQRIEHRGGNLVCLATEMRNERGQVKKMQFLSSFDDNGREIHRFGEKRHGYDLTKPVTVDEVGDYFPLQRWCLGDRGEVYIAPSRDNYEIEVRDSSGALLRCFARDFEPRLRSKGDLEVVKKGYTFVSENSALPEVKFHLAPTDMPIRSICWVSGELYVETSSDFDKVSKRLTKRYDIYRPDGRLLEERNYVIPFDEEEDAFVLLDTKRVLRVKAVESARDSRDASKAVKRGDVRAERSDAAGPLEVILYQIP